jgi:hypothetical protein
MPKHGRTHYLFIYIYIYIYICYAQTVKMLNEQKKRPERVVAIAKQPRPEISRCGRFVKATMRSGM